MTCFFFASILKIFRISISAHSTFDTEFEFPISDVITGATSLVTAKALFRLGGDNWNISLQVEIVIKVNTPFVFFDFFSG